MATGSPYQRRSSDDEIGLGKPQLTQTISNAYTISPELFEKVKVPFTACTHFCSALDQGTNFRATVYG
jgi:hypothetical protein